MAQTPNAQSERSWPGLDCGFQDRIRDVVSVDQGRDFRIALQHEVMQARGNVAQLGPPALVRKAYAARLRRFAASYHRAIETIIRAYSDDQEVQHVLSLPEQLRRDMDSEYEALDGLVHLCRLDLLLDADGGFQPVETNANCPGSLLCSGLAARLWREYLDSSGIEIPEPLDHEHGSWMARWFIEAATNGKGLPPTPVALLSQNGGNRLELVAFAEHFRREGVETLDADPRELGLSASGVPTLRGQEVRHGYLKLGMPEFRQLRSELNALVTAMQRRTLFVQNGLRGRFIGDNKLCLAILSDPSFEHLFDPLDLDLLRSHVPWSRNVSRCSSEELDHIRSERRRYVLKRPLDTRGRGVVVGQEIDRQAAWELALQTAVREGWLVQEFCLTTEFRADFNGSTVHLHDFTLGTVDGRVAGAFIRSGGELRLNMARTGRLHPVFMEA